MFEAGARWRPIGNRKLISYRVDVVGDDRLADVLDEFSKFNDSKIRSIAMIGKSKVKSVPKGTFTYELVLEL